VWEGESEGGERRKRDGGAHLRTMLPFLSKATRSAEVSCPSALRMNLLKERFTMPVRRLSMLAYTCGGAGYHGPKRGERDASIPRF
jgi:hypothetical protein